MHKAKKQISLDDIQKPHIALDCHDVWKCSGSGILGLGDSPEDAYRDWRQLIASCAGSASSTIE